MQHRKTPDATGRGPSLICMGIRNPHTPYLQERCVWRARAGMVAENGEELLYAHGYHVIYLMCLSVTNITLRTTPGCRCMKVINMSCETLPHYQARNNTVQNHHKSLQLLENTLTAPSPPQLMTHLPSGLHITLHTPSPRMMR